MMLALLDQQALRDFKHASRALWASSCVMEAGSDMLVRKGVVSQLGVS